jgi:hypothetical protein
MTKLAEAKLQQFYVFVEYGRYRRLIPYKTPNSNGKMTSDVYISILDQMQQDRDLNGKILFENCKNTSK